MVKFLGKLTLTKRVLGCALLLAVLLLGVAAVLASMHFAATLEKPGDNSTVIPTQTQDFEEFDSGWIDIRNNRGQNFTVTHNLNFSNLQVNVTGSTVVNGSVFQKSLGLTSNNPGFNWTYEASDGVASTSLIQTRDGGFVMFGSTSRPPMGNMYLVKVDGAGVMQWNRTFGKAELIGGSNLLVQALDGGFVMGGFTGEWESRYMVLVKTDADGNLLWQKTFTPEGGEDLLKGVFLTATGGYAMVAGNANWSERDPVTYDYTQCMVLVKTDAEGNQLSRKSCAVKPPIVAIQTRDWGYAIIEAGYTMVGRAKMPSHFLVKMAENGEVFWRKPPLNSTVENSAWAGERIVQTSEGGYAIAGKTRYVPRDAIQMVRMDANGDGLWQNVVGEWGDSASWLIQTADGGFALTGRSDITGAPSTTAGGDMILLKTDAEGNLQWRKTFGGALDDGGSSVIQADDGTLFATGATLLWRSEPFYEQVHTTYVLFLTRTDAVGEFGLTTVSSTANSLTLYRGRDDVDWNYVRVIIRKID